jgi:hypothetical protein
MALRPIVTPSSDPGGFAALASARVPAGYVRLTCSHPALDVLALMGEDSPHYTGGFGGWDVTARPRQVGMTTWAGVEPLELELGVLLDGFDAHQSQERVLRKLYAVARGDDDSPAGVLRVKGIPLAADRWVIDGLELGDAIRRRSDGALIRQALTLTLREYVPPQYLQIRRGALRGDKGKTKLVTVKRGDTPAKLARKHHCKWTDIRALNKTVHPPKQPWKANSDLRDGSKVRVPVASTRDRRAKGSRKSSKGHK